MVRCVGDFHEGPREGAGCWEEPSASPGAILLAQEGAVAEGWAVLRQPWPGFGLYWKTRAGTPSWSALLGASSPRDTWPDALALETLHVQRLEALVSWAPHGRRSWGAV